ncbi:MAG: adenylate kinase, partial [Peptococcaceae bacterium]|nr:adenylate kinase [Peptococcaceae bacterium]
SIDHLKMGLIRSGNTELTPMSDDKDLTAYLWPIVREMVKTAIENKQNLLSKVAIFHSIGKKTLTPNILKTSNITV